MARPVVGQAAEYWYEELQAAQPHDEDQDWPLLLLLGAFAAAFGPLHDIVRDTDDGVGYSSLMDPDRCPAFALPYLAQFAGVRLTQGVDDATQRAQINNPPGFHRGTPAAFTAAVKATLTGGQTCILLERDSDPYALTFVTRTAETPDPTATLAAGAGQKPAGLILTHVISDDALIDEGTLAIDSVAVGVTIDAAVTADIT